MGAPGTTPGPWRVVVNQTNINVSAYVGGRVALMAITPYSPHSPEGLANAHQNAASPDLYDALVWLLDEAYGNVTEAELQIAGASGNVINGIAKARKAIAKARGE